MYRVREYWDKRIEKWENSAYMLRDSPLSIPDLAARLFRAEAVKERLRVALGLLRPLIAGKTVLDLGCGGGFPALALLDHGAKKVTGIDISSKALEMAERRANALNLKDRLILIKGDVRTMELPAAEITVSLGLLDYLKPEEARSLISRLKSPIVLLIFTRLSPKPSLALQKLYHKAHGCPQLHFHSPLEITKLLLERGYRGLRVSTCKSMKLGTVIHNIQLE